VSLLEVWNTGDDVVLLQGGYGPGLAAVTDPASTVGRPPAESPATVLGRWADAIGADRPTTTHGANGATIVEHGGSPSGAVAQLVTVPGTGHGWPAGTTERVLAFTRDHARSG
jgi:hypothetical protein